MKKIYVATIRISIKRDNAFAKIFSKTMFSFLCVAAFMLASTNAAAQIARRGSTIAASKTTTTATTITLTKPTGVVAGDVMILTYSGAVPTLDGWTLIAGSPNIAALYRIAGTNEPASYTFNVGSGLGVAGLYAFSGVDTSGQNPLDAVIQPISGNTSGSASNYTGPANSITTLHDSAAVVMLSGLVSYYVSNFSGWGATSPATLSEIFDRGIAGTFGYSGGAAWAIKPVAGPTGSGFVSLSAGYFEVNGFFFALKYRPIKPIIGSIAPSNGCVGEPVVINGARFKEIRSVKFNGVEAAFTVNSTSQITATVPPGATTGVITVTNAGGTATSSSFTVNIPPVITSFSPASGPVGSSVTINGTGFNTTLAQNAVFFGATKATVTAATATSLTVTVPPGANYQYLLVTNLSGNLTGYASKAFNVTSSGIINYPGKVDLTAASAPAALALGDVDGDGKADIAVANNGSNSVSIFRNTSSGQTISFAAKTDLTTGTAPSAVAIADVDGDGKPDIIVINQSSATASIFRNTSSSGTISFAAKKDFTTGTGPTSVAVGDLDGDGKPELAVTNYGANSISVLRNNSVSGTIAFAAKVDLTTQSQPRSINIGDINGDGKQDLVAVNSGSNSVSVFANACTPAVMNFATQAIFTAGSTPNSVAIGDLDGDGKMDVVTANAGSNSLSVLRNTSTTSTVNFAVKVDLSTSNQPVFVAIADIDGDGKTDVAAANSSGNSISVLRNISVPGSLGFEGKTDFASGAGPSAIVVGDIDNDGKPDMAVSNQTAGTVSVLQQVCATPIITSISPAQALPGDVITISGSNFSNSGSVDFAGVSMAVTSWSKTSIQATLPANVFKGSITVTNQCGLAGSFNYTIPPKITSFLPQSGPIGTSVTISGSGFNTTPAQNIVFFGAVKAVVTAATVTSLTVTVPLGANYQNISVTNLAAGFTAYSTKPFVVTLNGAITFKNSVGFATNTGPYPAASADFDGDGKADMVVGNSNALLSVLRNTSVNGAINFDNKLDVTATVAPVDIAIADLDGDGKPDIASANLSGNNVSLLRNISTGAGNIGFATKFDLPGFSGGSAGAVAIGDIDGDGKPDIAFTNQFLNLLSIYRNASVAGSLSFDTRIDMSGGSASRSIKIADIDGDGKPDIILSTDAQTFQVYLNKSTSGSISLASKVSFTTGSGSYALSVGDINGDGKPDVAVVNENSNTLSVLLNTSTQGTVSFAAKVDYSLDRNPRAIALGDIDGDGKIDIAVSCFNSNMLSVFRNTSTAGSLNLTKSNFTTDANPRGIVFGDLNGDAKPDLAVANNGANTISIFQQDCVSPDIPTLNASSTNNCGAQSTTLSIASGNLNNAANWQWYTGSCGGTNIASGTSINITPAVTTTYYARGEGGCAAAGPCASITITVNNATTWYHDSDGDGFGNAADTAHACSTPTGYVADNSDCNDADATVHAPVQYYIDADHDGYGSNTTTLICSSTAPIGYSTNNTDCNDADAGVHTAITYYADNDGDGFGDLNNKITACSSVPPTGYVTNSLDCDDSKLLYADADGDGYGAGLPVACGVANNSDYNDNDPAIHVATSTSAVNICPSSLPYYWNGNTYNTAGTYIVQLTAAGGADSIATLILTVKAGPISATLTADNIFACFNGKRPITVTVAGGVKPYLYSINGGGNWQTAKSFSMPAGTYTAMVKDTSGCTLATNSVTIAQPEAKLSVVSAIESSSTIVVTATGGYEGYTYSLNNGAYQPTNTFASYHTGVDTVFVKDSVGCTVSKLMNTLTITVAAENGDTMVCAGQKRKILAAVKGGAAPYLFTLDGTNYQTSKTFAVEAGNYTITVKDARNNIVTAAAITITTPAAAPAISTGKHNVSCTGNNDGSITLNPADGTSVYTYRIGTGAFASNNLFTGLTAGKYAISALDQYGCTVNKTVTITEPVTPCLSLSSSVNQTAGTAEMKGELRIRVLPNPAQVAFNLQILSGDSRNTVELRVMDMAGKVVYQTRGSIYDIYTFGRQFAGGTYIAEVLNGRNVQRIKLIKAN